MTSDKSFQEDSIEAFFLGQKTLDYKRQEIILRAEDTPQGVYYLTQGFVRVYLLTKDGIELTINILHPRSFFPLAWAILNVPNVYFFEAMTNISVHRASLSDFLGHIHSDIKFMHEVNRTLIYSYNRSIDRLQNMVLGNAKQKVANVLLMLAGRMGKVQKKYSGSVTIPITHQQIANLAALSRESVGAEIKSLTSEGLIISQYRTCTIINSKTLQKKYCFYTEAKPLPFIC